jgi:exopolysaccharide biosynthesis polyprenyl glycosylphosphotransferase
MQPLSKDELKPTPAALTNEAPTVPRSTKTNPWLLRPGERRTLLLIVDLLFSSIALLIALYLWSIDDQWLNFSVEFLRTRPQGWLYLLPVAWLILLVEIYDEHRAANWRFTVRSIITAGLIGIGLYIAYFFLAPLPKTLPRRPVLYFVISATMLTLIWRIFYIRVFTSPNFLRRVLLVGAGQTGQTILKIVKDIQPPPYHWVGIIDDDPNKIGTSIERLPVFGGSDQLLETICKQEVTDIVVAISGEMNGSMFQALLDSQELGISITRMPVAYEELLGRVPIKHLEADWILRSFVDQARTNNFYELGKRLVDIIGALFGGTVFLITFPFIAFAILIDSGFPIFYLQTRAGRGASLYHIIKYRTMYRDAEPDGTPQWAEENDRRATRVGRYLRKTHLDELPQFLNILRGEMSLVGPRAERPELVAWFQKHVPFYRARLLVKPGMTGWAQVNFGYASTIEETIVKLEYDLYYIKHRNPILDLVIILRTPSTVLGLRGR